MRTFIFSLVLLAAISLVSAQSPDPAFEGYRLSFQLGQEYQKIAIQGGTVDAYNALVGKWNIFVRTNYGENSGLLMQPMGAENANMQRPWLYSNNTTSKGIVHAIDGSGKNGASWTTNDINAMPENARLQYANTTAGKTYGSDYLGGV